MWIPRPVYEAIPYAWLAVGAMMIGAAFWLGHGPRSVLFGGGGLCIVLGLVLWMKRRDYRSTQSNYDPRALDE